MDRTNDRKMNIWLYTYLFVIGVLSYCGKVVAFSPTHHLSRVFSSVHQAKRRQQTLYSSTVGPDDNRTKDELLFVRISSSSSSSSSRSSSSNNGLIRMMDRRELEWKNRLDKTLDHLRTQLPNVLWNPLTSNGINDYYTDNITILGPNDKIIASGRQELQILSNTLVTTTTTARRVANQLSSSFNTSTTTAGWQDEPELECELVVVVNNNNNNNDNDNDDGCTKVHVKWSTQLQQRRLEGYSELTLSPKDAKIDQHQILHITFDDYFDGSSIIGDTLSMFRRAVKTFSSQTTASTSNSNPLLPSFLQNSPIGPVMKNIQDDFLQKTFSSPNNKNNKNQTISHKPAPLFFLPQQKQQQQQQQQQQRSNTTAKTKGNDISHDQWIPSQWHSVDQNDHETKNDTTKQFYNPPYPGGKAWKEFVSLYNLYDSFYHTSIPLLGYGKKSSSSMTTVSSSIQSLFVPNAKLIGSTKSTSDDDTGDNENEDDVPILLQSGSKLADFYTNLLVLRKSTNNNWSLDKVVIHDWYNRQVDIHWTSHINPIATTIQGIDRFTLSSSSLTQPQIECVQQMELMVGENIIEESSIVSTFIRAVIDNKPIGVDVLSSLMLDRLPTQTTNNINTNNMEEEDARLDEVIPSPKVLSPSAAVQFYDILCSIHQEIPRLFQDGTTTIPLVDYFSSQIVLRGLLGEVIANDSKRYQQIVNPALTSLSAAIQSKFVKLDYLPTCKHVDFTNEGNIQVDIVIPLRMEYSTFPSPLDILQQQQSQKQKQKQKQRMSNRLYLEIITEYCIDPNNGQIIEQRLLESRINGQLTPGDLVSRWLGRTNTNKSGSSSSNNPSIGGSGATAVRVLLDALQFARSVNN